MAGYITVAEADIIIADYFPAFHKWRTAWEALTAADKNGYLNQALAKLESIAYIGRKANPKQPLQFPRKGQDGIPEGVKQAQAIEACATVSMAGAADQRAQLQAQGITSFSAGNLSETYGKTASGAGKLFSILARELLQPYLLGVVPFA